jgi:hypothetical protein
MVCDPRNIREDLVRETPGVALLRTKRGSHVAFNDGLLGQSSFLARTAFDFLDAAREVATLEPGFAPVSEVVAEGGERFRLGAVAS